MFWFGLVTGPKQWVLSHWVYGKREKNLRLCLVAVKCFPENTYFPEMLISGKGKCFHGV